MRAASRFQSTTKAIVSGKFIGPAVVTRDARAYRAHAFRSYASLPRASTIVCHSMFETGIGFAAGELHDLVPPVAGARAARQPGRGAGMFPPELARGRAGPVLVRQGRLAAIMLIAIAMPQHRIYGRCSRPVCGGVSRCLPTLGLMQRNKRLPLLNDLVCGAEECGRYGETQRFRGL